MAANIVDKIAFHILTKVTDFRQYGADPYTLAVGGKVATGMAEMLRNNTIYLENYLNEHKEDIRSLHNELEDDDRSERTSELCEVLYSLFPIIGTLHADEIDTIHDMFVMYLKHTGKY